MGELILGLLGGMAALAALLGGLWRRERGKRERAEAREGGPRDHFEI